MHLTCQYELYASKRLLLASDASGQGFQGIKQCTINHGNLQQCQPAILMTTAD